jgi:hypothetical protein
MHGVRGDLGTRHTAEAVDQDIPVRSQVKFATGFKTATARSLKLIERAWLVAGIRCRGQLF